MTASGMPSPGSGLRTVTGSPAGHASAAIELSFSFGRLTATGIRQLAAREGLCPGTILAGSLILLISRLDGSTAVTVNLGMPADRPQAVIIEIAPELSVVRYLRRLARGPLGDGRVVLTCPAPLPPGTVPGSPRLAVDFRPAAGFGAAGGYAAIPSGCGLSLTLTEPAGHAGRLCCQLRADPELVTHAAPAMLRDRFLVTTRSVVTDPGGRVRDLHVLPAGERAMVVRDWNRTGSAWSAETTLHDLVTTQIERAPDAVAIRDGGRDVRYGDLGARARAIGTRLRARGIGAGSIVGIVMDRTSDRVAACLAVLQSGAAFLPIDPGDPPARIARMLEDSGADVLVCDRRCSWPGMPRMRTVPLGHDSWPLTGSDEQAAPLPGNLSGPGDLAYVIYTSGSTGPPKGVMIEHRAVCNRLLWMRERFAVSQEARVLHKASPSFDISLWEVFLPLISGGVLVLGPPGCEASPPALSDVIESESVTIAHFVPSVLRFFRQEAGTTPITRLETVVTSGEVLDADLASSVGALGVTLANLYGPTEAAIDATAWTWEHRPDGVVPIGSPISNMRAHIVDEQVRPVPVGVAGEIVLAGIGLARGYLGRDELTARSFVPDRVTGRAGERLYRTGDLGRYLPDGNIEFLGRSDDQVKILGHRIELAEVEAAIRRHPGISDAAVIVQSRTRDGGRLAAFVVACGDAPTRPELRSFLAGDLVAAAIPSSFMFASSIPRTAAQKVDKQALQSLRLPCSDQPKAPPRTDLERAMTGIWEDVLGLSSIGIDDHFLDLGGDSLLGVRLVGRIAASLDLRVGVADLFDAGTIACLAGRIAGRAPADAVGSAPLIH